MKMPNFGNKIKSIKSIFGLNNSVKSGLSELKKEKFEQKKKTYRESLLPQKVIQLKLTKK